MSLDPSIENVGEYYSSHYLATTFSGDVKNLIADWRRQGSDAVPRRVQQLSRRYFGAKAQALEEDAPSDRWRAGDDLSAWHSHLLEHLGYTERSPVDIPVEGAKTCVPAVARVHRYSRLWLVICETVFCLPSASLKDGMAAAFLSAETLCPDGESDEAIHDRLEKQSHRFAHGVTENLQAAVREGPLPAWLQPGIPPGSGAGPSHGRHRSRDLFPSPPDPPVRRHPQGGQPRQPEAAAVTERIRKAFTIRPLTATLFDPAATPLLNNARLTNRCLQTVIRNLSLSRDESRKSIGRVNYAELGIHQLGAVYEGLLSYKGMFAGEDLIQVKAPRGSFEDKNTPTWFVPASRISYYTPLPLTQCTVAESLRELLKDLGPADADRILEMNICELAMGSGAFLNEAAEQLARRYLELKQKGTGETIEPGRFQDELRRAKHYIVTRNIYGVDLEPNAVELGALSLWLGSIHKLGDDKGDYGEPDRRRAGATPWFGPRLRCGDSLIGARRAVWKKEDLLKGRHVGAKGEKPRQLKPGEAREKDEIYHFLVFDEEMAPAAGDRLMRRFHPDACEAAKRWRAVQVKKKWDGEAVAEALAISDRIDWHWERYSSERVRALEKTACTATVWPVKADSAEAVKAEPTLERQEAIKARLESASGGFQRLKLVMDVWCALWFWPLEGMDGLPDRKAFLTAAGLLLGTEPPAAEMQDWISADMG